MRGESRETSEWEVEERKDVIVSLLASALKPVVLLGVMGTFS